MIINSQRTIYGLELQADMLINGNYTPRVNTTLNEKFNILPNEPIGADTNYTIKYLAIGTGSGAVTTNPQGYSYSQHGPLDASLFEQIPFLIRLATDDIPASRQVNYRLKVPITINGLLYYQYFLRRLAPTDITTDTYRITMSGDGVTSLVALDINTSLHLNPVPTQRTRLVGGDQVYVNKSIKLKFSLTPEELVEVNNAIDILHGPLSNKSITEIGVCGGVEKTVAGVIEAIHTQIYFHIEVDIGTNLSYDPVIGYLRAIELGGCEPLYV